MIKNAIEVMDKQCTANAALIREAVEGMEEQVACQVVAAIERLRFELTTCPRYGERCGVLFGRGGGGGSGRESIFSSSYSWGPEWFTTAAGLAVNCVGRRDII